MLANIIYHRNTLLLFSLVPLADGDDEERIHHIILLTRTDDV